MALPQAEDPGLTPVEAAERLGTNAPALLERLIRMGLLYRYTGIGRPLAYVRWVREGLFANTPAGVRITRRGRERIRKLPDRG